MSNWSAPNEDTQGRMPPDPNAIVYNDTYKKAICRADAGAQKPK